MKRLLIAVSVMINICVLLFILNKFVDITENNFKFSQKNSELEIKLNKKIKKLYIMIQQTPVGGYIEVNKDLIAFTDNLYGDFNHVVMLYILTKKDAQIVVNKLEKTGKTNTIYSSVVNGEDFHGISFNTIDGFEKTLFRKIDIPLKYPSNGWYEIDILIDGYVVQTIPYLVRPQKNDSEIAFVANTNTMVAYLDSLNIRSNYGNDLSLPGPYTRPHAYPYNYSISRTNLGCDHFAGADKFFHIWMLKHSLEFDIIDDDFLLDFNKIKLYKTIVFGVHDEYWDKRTFFNVKRFIDHGGNIIFLGGNTAYRVMENRSSYKAVINNFAFDDKLLKKYIYDYIGTSISGYKSYAPYKMLKNKHILMQGVADIFGEHSLNTCNSGQDGASGWETDNLIDGAIGFTILAKGMNSNNDGADLVYKNFTSGAKLVNFGSLSLAGSLNDKNINRLLENIFKHFGHKIVYANP